MTDPIAEQVDRILDQAAAQEIDLAAIPVRAELDDLIHRGEQIATLRAAKGHALGGDARAGIEQLYDSLGRLANVLEGETQP